MKVALVYDRINKWGGAERVLLALHELFPDAPLYTSVYNKKTAPWAESFQVKTSFLQQIHFLRDKHEYLAPLMPLVFESFKFDEYDVVISVTSEAAKGIITKPGTKHICYCLTPTRYLWSGYQEYFKNPLLRIGSFPMLSYLKKWDQDAALRPDAYIAISDEVRNRIKEYYHRDSSVVYPPIFLSKEFNGTEKNKKEDFFLIVSRLVPYKKVDIAIQACNELQIPLKIIGTGSDVQRLKSMAGKTITFIGSIRDVELVQYYKQCKALLFPGYEDFGLAMAEAQYFGTPVIAYKKGGSLEIVAEGKTGLFFTPQTKEALKKSIAVFLQKKFNESDCIARGEKFSLTHFKANFRKSIDKILTV